MLMTAEKELLFIEEGKIHILSNLFTFYFQFHENNSCLLVALPGSSALFQETGIPDTFLNEKS